MTLTVKPLSPALGAEIAGLDLREDISDATFAEILDVWHQHLVILFRGQSLSEDDQIRFAERFGTLQKRTRPADKINEAGHTKYPQLTMLVSNIRENGKLIGSLPDGEMHFHSDQCYIEKPATGTFLYALEVPSSGGDTLFLNMYKAYDALPAEMKARVDGRKALNAHLYDSTTRAVNGSMRGSIMAEWKACEVTSRRQAIPSRLNSCSNFSKASNGPATTHKLGAFTAARARSPFSLERTSDSAIRTESIPPAGTACIMRPRAATRLSASSSEKMPARQAATNSPMLCPSMACGRMPQVIQSCASAYSMEKIAGCATIVSVTRRLASSVAPSGG